MIRSAKRARVASSIAGKLAPAGKGAMRATVSGGLGGVPEWLNGAVSKTVVGLSVHRGFESLPLRLARRIRFAGTGTGRARAPPRGPAARLHAARGLRVRKRPSACSVSRFSDAVMPVPVRRPRRYETRAGFVDLFVRPAA